MVQIAYPNLRKPARVDMALDVFSRSLDNQNLQRHMLAVAPVDIDAAVRVAEEYLQVGAPRDSYNVRGVDLDDESIRVTLNKILKKLEDNSQAIEKISQVSAENAQAIADLKKQLPVASSVKKGATGPRKSIACYGCGGDHMIKDCLHQASANLVQHEQGNKKSLC